MSWTFILAILAVTAFSTLLAQPPTEPRKSCRDHYLNGESGSKTLPLSFDGQTIFNVQCEMPPEGESNNPTQIAVRNALERWHRLGTEKETVGYQISNWAYLRSIMEDSDSCYQELSVIWAPDMRSDRGNEFSIESIKGNKRTFRFNSSKPTTEEVFVLDDADAGVLHIYPPTEGNSTIEIKTTALRCRQTIVKDAKCLFELNSSTDRIGVDVGGSDTVSFAFRIDASSTPLLTLIGSDNGQIIVDILDGYLIAINQFVQPVKLLADGNWHTALVDIKNLVLYMDGKHNTAISLNNSGRVKQLKALDIRVNGSVTAISLNNGAWECEESLNLKVSRTQKILRKICPAYEPSFCQCKGPNTALLPRGSHGTAQCGITRANKAYTMTRNSSHLSFFYYSQYKGPETVSVLFKSDSDLGLVLLGQHKDSNKSKQRYQVQYEGETMSAISCLIEQNQQHACRVCSIKRRGGFARNEWIRVSIFYHQNFMYLTVDGQICQLSPNERGFGLTDLYQINAQISDVLFVGGTYYKKTEKTPSRIKDDFKNHFFENTLEKAPSLRGCIAEIRVGGRILDLEDVVRKQNNQILADSERPVFSIERGCFDCTDFQDLCQRAPCRAVSPFQPRTAVCDCARDFSVRSPVDGSCLTTETDKFKPHALTLSHPQPISIEQSLGFVKQSVVDKIWALIRFPETSSELHVLLDFGEIRVLVGDYGRNVVVEVSDHKEQFSVRIRDERLHLISIQRNPSMSASTADRTLTIQLDGDKRIVQRPRIPIHAGSTLQISPIPVQSSEFSGCINDLSISFEYEEDVVLSSEHLQQHELISNIIIKPVMAPNVSQLLIFGDGCGIRDPTIWEENSTSLGLIGEYDPEGTSQTFTSERTGLITLIVIILLVLVVLLLLLGYCYKRGKKHTYKTNGSGYTPADEKLLMNNDNYTDGTSNGSPPPKIRPDFVEVSPNLPHRPIIVPGVPVTIEQKNEVSLDYPTTAKPVAVRRLTNDQTSVPGTPTSTKAPIAHTEDV